MKTKAVRLYGKNDLRLEEFELPKIKDDEILAKVVCDSICMSSYKASHEADIHKRVPRDIAQNPVIIGHEFAGELVSEHGDAFGELLVEDDVDLFGLACHFEHDVPSLRKKSCVGVPLRRI